MRDYERKIKEQAKKEVKNFDLWYKNNELKLINSKIYPSYYATKQLEKPKFRKGWWYACVVTSLFLLIAGLLFRGNNLINNNIFLDENIFFPITQSNNAIYNNKLENEFDILMQSEMGFKLSYDEMKSFYVVLSGEEDLFLYGVKSEIKTLQDKYFLTFYFPERYSDIKNKADFKDL